MKENNKFSLSAFFCSLGSKSKIFMLFLLGAPFLLVQFFTLKVYANSAVVPVVPEGLSTSGIGSSGVVPGDPSLMYYTLLIALGLKADEVYQVNKADIIDSVTEALNDYDSVNDPTLGDDLETYLEWYDNAKSQNGYINELSISRSLWDRLNKATSSGLNVRINNQTGSTTYNDFISYVSAEYNITNNQFPSSSFASPVIEFIISGQGLFCLGTDSYTFDNNTLTIEGGSAMAYEYNGGLYLWQNNSRTFNNVSSVSVVGSTSKHIGVARPFISSKTNGTYDVLSKSGVINDQTGDLEGDVTMSILSYDKIKDIASDYEDSATDIPVFFPDSRLVPIDIENPDAIPDSVGIPGDTPQEIVDSLADTFDPSPAEPIVIEPFNYIDQWDPVIPIATESPLVGLPFVMNWVAEQMQITMFLSQFSNTWLVLSTLAVASCLVGLVRIWR